MRYLVVRIGALGDAIVTTPLVRWMAAQGHQIVFLGSKESQIIYENNPRIDKFVLHEKDSVANHLLSEYFADVAKENGCEKVIDLCESIEVRLALSPNYPQWNWSKTERRTYCDKNYYRHTFVHAGFSPSEMEMFANEREFFRPEMFFTKDEEDFISDIRKNLLGYRTIMWGLSGSGRQKTYPYFPEIIERLLHENEKLKVILVGGNSCKILECALKDDKRIEKLSGEFNFRQSALMAKYVDCVVSPDTGFLHAAGMWKTPKVALLTHTSPTNITRTFENTHPIQSAAPCSPCYRLIDCAEEQCPKEPVSEACVCMSRKYMPPKEVYEAIKLSMKGDRDASCRSSEMPCVCV